MKLIILTLSLSLCMLAADKKAAEAKPEVPVIDLATQNEILATQMELKEAEKAAMPYNFEVRLKQQATVEPSAKAIAQCNPTATKEEIAAGKTPLVLDFQAHKVVCVPRPAEQAAAHPPQSAPADNPPAQKQ